MSFQQLLYTNKLFNSTFVQLFVYGVPFYLHIGHRSHVVEQVTSAFCQSSIFIACQGGRLIVKRSAFQIRFRALDKKILSPTLKSLPDMLFDFSHFQNSQCNRLFREQAHRHTLSRQPKCLGHSSDRKYPRPRGSKSCQRRIQCWHGSLSSNPNTGNDPDYCQFQGECGCGFYKNE